ncbi:MAG: hypothetical protein IJ379_12030 [Lachnospiraceae bacterium]|nr:hypothetical protein [Lachnospiraceae bacterium]
MKKRLLQNKFFEYLNSNCQEENALEFYEACHNNWGIATACMKAGLFRRWVELCKNLDKSNRGWIMADIKHCEASMVQKDADEDMILSVWLCKLIPHMPYIAGFFWKMQLGEETKRTTMSEIVTDVADWYEKEPDFSFEVGECYWGDKEHSPYRYKMDLLLSAIQHHLFSTHRSKLTGIREYEDAFLKATEDDKKRALGELMNCILFNVDTLLRYDKDSNKFEVVENAHVKDYDRYISQDYGRYGSGKDAPKELLQEEILLLSKVAEYYYDKDIQEAYKYVFIAKKRLDILVNRFGLTKRVKELIKELYGRSGIKILKKAGKFQEYIEALNQFEEITKNDIENHGTLVDLYQGIEETNAPFEIRNHIFFKGIEKMVLYHKGQGVSLESIGAQIYERMISYRRCSKEKDSVEEQMICLQNELDFWLDFEGQLIGDKFKYLIIKEIKIEKVFLGPPEMIAEELDKIMDYVLDRRRGITKEELAHRNEICLRVGDRLFEMGNVKLAKVYYVEAMSKGSIMTDEYWTTYRERMDKLPPIVLERNECAIALFDPYKQKLAEETVFDEVMKLYRDFALRLRWESRIYKDIQYKEELQEFFAILKENNCNRQMDLAEFYYNITKVFSHMSRTNSLVRRIKVIFLEAAIQQLQERAENISIEEPKLWEKYTSYCYVYSSDHSSHYDYDSYGTPIKNLDSMVKKYTLLEKWSELTEKKCSIEFRTSCNVKTLHYNFLQWLESEIRCLPNRTLSRGSEAMLRNREKRVAIRKELEKVRDKELEVIKGLYNNDDVDRYHKHLLPAEY